jgi:hypothetical protein
MEDLIAFLLILALVYYPVIIVLLAVDDDHDFVKNKLEFFITIFPLGFLVIGGYRKYKSFK